jgi:hypothetical protein
MQKFTLYTRAATHDEISSSFNFSLILKTYKLSGLPRCFGIFFAYHNKSTYNPSVQSKPGETLGRRATGLKDGSKLLRTLCPPSRQRKIPLVVFFNVTMRKINRWHADHLLEVLETIGQHQWKRLPEDFYLGFIDLCDKGGNRHEKQTIFYRIIVFSFFNFYRFCLWGLRYFNRKY